MKKQIITLTFLLGATFFTGYCQDLLSVDWQQVVCSDSKIDHVYSICHDKGGSTYTLGDFPGTANFLGETLSDTAGSCFLTKQDIAGNKVFAINLGNNKGYSNGDLKISDNGDIVLGLCFTDTFFLNGSPLVTSSDYNNIILKLDSELNVKWFQVFQAKYNTYIKNLALDEDENIYASILFIDSLSINGNLYKNKQGYGTAIAKLDSSGNVLWTHHFYSDYYLVNHVLEIETSTLSNQAILFITGTVGGDSIFVDGALMAIHKSKYNGQYFVGTINKEGEILHAKFIDDGIRQVTDISFFQDRVFFAGVFSDTVSWNENQIIPDNCNSIYIGELNHKAEIIGFADLHSNEEIFLTGFKTSPQYGFVLSGCFNGSFSFQSSSIMLEGYYDRGSFIASINDTLGLNDCKYIEGGSYHLFRLSFFKNKLLGAGVFERTCNFANQTCFAYNSDISTFQTTDIKQLSSFSPYQFPSPGLLPLPVYPDEFTVSIFPNPFKETFTMRYSEPVWLTSLTITNLKGQVLTNYEATQDYGFVTYVNCQNLEPGVYIIQYTTSNKFKGARNILKIE
ncbi:MAG: T9SS type A sorting domain-containing protein [Bacteroidales bacterium]|nr:T9SS type A sorting domain-containing protein [Bacteroidales bacterium]MCF8457217.1 T9SS type A sorting domain-containing protein [Bacteroidales bacterium]